MRKITLLGSMVLTTTIATGVLSTLCSSVDNRAAAYDQAPISDEIAKMHDKLMQSPEYTKKLASWGLQCEYAKRQVAEIVRAGIRALISIEGAFNADGTPMQILALDARDFEHCQLMHSRIISPKYARDLLDYKKTVDDNSGKMPEKKSDFHLVYLPYISTSLLDKKGAAYTEKTKSAGVNVSIAFSYDPKSIIFSSKGDLNTPQGGNVEAYLNFILRNLKVESNSHHAQTLLRGTLRGYNETLLLGNELARKVGAIKPLYPIAIMVPDTIFRETPINKFLDSEQHLIREQRQKFFDALQMFSANDIPVILYRHEFKGENLIQRTAYTPERGTLHQLISGLDFPTRYPDSKIVTFKFNGFCIFPHFDSVKKSEYDACPIYKKAIDDFYVEYLKLKKLLLSTETNWKEDAIHRVNIVTQFYKVNRMMIEASLGLLCLTPTKEQLEAWGEDIKTWGEYIKNIKDKIEQSRVWELYYNEELDRLVGSSSGAAARSL